MSYPFFLGGIRTPKIKPTKADAEQNPVEQFTEEERKRRDVLALLDSDEDADDFDDEDDDGNQSVASEHTDVDDYIARKNASINEHYTRSASGFPIPLEPSSLLQLKQVISLSPPPYSGLFNNMIKSSYHRR
ncbi:uncharacterized protein P174DRAFT_463615 [Aspergillus novofumigatus IBT 16806]|uniref:Uncharacterized protein n=1 Tax=Aspergillus novofumigatus (strain IBT 16806) TaxID=1392255 RepID=A0A2I1BXN5_ASPN1|nr:uncharacterized protein P174DRAFT_463615 [Aspergillus novofumigatus IBT 16806]PKX90154.1 hypothetical protein P174DRAFT_463615 [Aspergillus novofumigatus IBT 16806]